MLFRSVSQSRYKGYYKQMAHYLDYKSGAVINMNEHIERDVVETKGEAYGAEIMLKKPLGKLNGWLAYTYSKTMLRQEGDISQGLVNRGEWYPASYDKPHDLKIVANYKFTQRLLLLLQVLPWLVCMVSFQVVLILL